MPWSSGSRWQAWPMPSSRTTVAGAGVEDQVPPGGLLVRQDPQQDQRPDPGVAHVGVGEALQRLVDRLGVDALAGLGVVLHLDGERAADRLDEHLVLDRDVRVPAEHVVVAGGLDPLEVVRRREDVVALAPVVQIGHVAVRGRPASAAPGCPRCAARSGTRPAACPRRGAAAAAGSPGSSGTARRSRAGTAGRRAAPGSSAGSRRRTGTRRRRGMNRAARRRRRPWSPA